MKAVRWAGAILLLGLTGCGPAEPAPVMPEVTGLRLDVALSDIERAGSTDEVEVLGGGMFGVLDESNWTVCDQEPLTGQPMTSTPRLTIDRSCGDGEAENGEPPADEPAEDVGASDEPAEDPAHEVDAYAYEGPVYEIVTVDGNIGVTGLDQYWVHVSELDVTTDAYRDQVRAIVADIAHAQGTDHLIVAVVTDREIIEAESDSTIAQFMEEHTSDNYFRDVIAPKETTDWVASYTGGFDPNSGEPSDAATAFEIIWWPYGDTAIEQWRPEPF